MKSRLVIIILLVVAKVFAGSEGVGGGDPHVVEFLRISQETCTWALKYQTQEFPNIFQCQKIIDSLKASLVEGAVAKMIFTDEELFDEDGISKVALFNRNEMSIRVNRPFWKNLVTKDKYITAGIEIAGLSNVAARYEFGKNIAKEYGSVFEPNAFPTYECFFTANSSFTSNSKIIFSSKDLEQYNKELQELTGNPNDSCGICQAGKPIIIQSGLPSGKYLKVLREYIYSQAHRVVVEVLNFDGTTNSVMSFGAESKSFQIELMTGQLAYSCERLSQ